MRKTLVLIIHVLAVLTVTVAFSALYTDNSGSSGIAWIQAPAYQDAPQFAENVNSDIADIKRMAFLRDVFGDAALLGEQDAEQEILVSGTRGGQNVSYTLQELLELAEGFGDRIDLATGACELNKESGGDAENFELHVTEKKYDPDFLEYTTPGPSQGVMSIRGVCQEVLKELSEYLTLNARYTEQAGNLHFVVYYPSPREEYVIVSNTDLPEETLLKSGKYVYAEGTSQTVNTNIEPVPSEAVYVPFINRDEELDEYYRLYVGIDTAFPFEDRYQEAAQQFGSKVAEAYTWIAVGVVAMVLWVITLILILSDASRSAEEPGSRHLMDRLPFEVFVLLMACLSVVFYYLFKATLCRAMEAIVPYHQQEYWRTVAKVLITYGLIILILRSAIRRYRMGELYQNSMFNRMEQAIENYLENLSRSGGIFVRYFVFTAVNIAGTLTVTWLFATRDRDSRRILIAAMLTGAIIIMDALVYNSLFRQARQRDAIGKALKDISTGETSVKLPEKEFSGAELEDVKDINHIAVGLSSAVQDQVRSERLKADLITNVSHDIKTPLTSIINYVGLLKRENIRDEKALEYIDVLERKSERLKKLIEDLVEASKASSGNVKIELAKIDIVELAIQAAAEFEDKFASRQLEFCFTPPEAPVYVSADGRHLWRIFDNLLNNASKYALEGTRIYGDVAVDTDGDEEGSGTCTFTIKNISATKLNISPDELTERFVRGDVSRTTEGSGLGLSIATSLCSLMGGKLKIEIDGDLYKANVILPLYRDTEESVEEE